MLMEHAFNVTMIGVKWSVCEMEIMLFNVCILYSFLKF